MSLVGDEYKGSPTRQNTATGDYVGWDDNRRKVMDTKPYWWNYYFVDGQWAFRVPNEFESENADAFWTLQDNNDKSISLVSQLCAVVGNAVGQVKLKAIG